VKGGIAIHTGGNPKIDVTPRKKGGSNVTLTRRSGKGSLGKKKGGMELNGKHGHKTNNG